MLAKATRAIQEHVKDVTEKTRATCCIGKPAVKRDTYQNNYNVHCHSAYPPGAQENRHHPQPHPHPHSHHHPSQSPPGSQNTYQQPYLSPALPPAAAMTAHPIGVGREPPQKLPVSPLQNHHENHRREKSPSRYHSNHTLNQPNQLIPNGVTPPPGYSVPHANDGAHYVIDNTSGTTYIRGKLLGKGGFAKCYEMTDVRNNKAYAGKIISKNRLAKPHQKEKILREIELHKSLRHSHVVSFHSYFEDDDCVYIILENCSRKSLVHVLKARKTLTEPEVRYFMRHLVEGCRYIHSRRVIHRDLKLGNMLINEAMNVKIADFGLATKVEYEGEKKMTVCGTPNYIAPEVLQKRGHSYEADIWAMGCIMYAMLVGRPPFETSTLKETYMRITANKFFVPPHVSRPARHLIQRLLSPEPHQRPALDKILNDEYFIAGYMPKSLSTSCCDSAPKFPSSNSSSVASIPSRPRSYAAPVSSHEAMQKIQSSLAQLKGSKRSASQIITRTEKTAASPSSKDSAMRTTASTPSGVHRTSASDVGGMPMGSAIRLYQMLTTCLEQMPEDASPSPIHQAGALWVTKWVDYSNKYGFGFQLSDKSVGILFNDTTRMLLTTDGRTVQYNDLSNKVYTFTTDAAPAEHQKKVTLLLYFAQYMDEHLIHGGNMAGERGGEAPQLTAIFMKKWFRTGKAIVMYLNNGTLQVNFFDDHTKVILWPDGQDYLVTYINSKRQAVAYRLLQFRHFGCHADIQERLRYARRMLESIINIEGEAV